MNMKAHAFSTTIITFSLLSITITITIVYVCAYAIFARSFAFKSFPYVNDSLEPQSQSQFQSQL
jgi:hypothetical protein